MTAVAAGASCSSTKEQPTGEADARFADVAYVNGRLFTADNAQPSAEAVAISRGRFDVVGPDDMVERRVGPDTEVIDLEGAFVVPGMHDVHMHAMEVFSHRADGRLVLAPDADIATVTSTIRKYVSQNRDRSWIMGETYKTGLFPDDNGPKALLDELVPDRPAAILHESGHALWVNSKALAVAGIDAATPDPPDGFIVRLPGSSEPQGTLKEAAMPLVQKFCFDVDHETYKRAARMMAAEMNAAGITAGKSATGRQTHLDALRAVDEEGGLTLRYVMSWNGVVFIQPNGGTEQQMRDSLDSTTPNVRSDSVKIFVDGLWDSRTVSLLEPYTDDPSTSGEQLMSPEQVAAAVAKYDAMGLSVIAHTIGDRASRDYIAAVAAARATNPRSGLRHQLSHATLVSKDQLAQVRSLGMALDFTPIMPFEKSLGIVDPYLGPERADRIFPMRWAVDAEVRPSVGTDFSLTPFDPFEKIQRLVTRHNTGASQAIDVAEALRAYTINGAYVMGHEEETGSIAAGKSADMVVLDRNLFEIPVDTISHTRVQRTVFRGVPVFVAA